MRFDFTDVQDFEVLPAGSYAATIDSIVETESERSEFPNLVWTFTLTEGDHAGRKLFKTTGLGPKALWSLRDTLVGLGYDKEDLEGEVDVDTDELEGTDVVVVISVGRYNNRDVNQVDAVSLAASGEEEEATEDDEKKDKPKTAKRGGGAKAGKSRKLS